MEALRRELLPAPMLINTKSPTFWPTYHATVSVMLDNLSTLMLNVNLFGHVVGIMCPCCFKNLYKLSKVVQTLYFSKTCKSEESVNFVKCTQII